MFLPESLAAKLNSMSVKGRLNLPHNRFLKLEVCQQNNDRAHRINSIGSQKRYANPLSCIDGENLSCFLLTGIGFQYVLNVTQLIC
ncbi:hypothetical protein H6G91_29470 [Nostoc muscorum FACHB-395]|nr:hypothetical protein [Desmonostoc muscorum FACHB-395]